MCQQVPACVPCQARQCREVTPARNVQHALGSLLSRCPAWFRNWVAGQLGQAEGLLASFRLYCVVGFNTVLVNLHFQTIVPFSCDAGGWVPSTPWLPGGSNPEQGGRVLGTHPKYVACGGPSKFVVTAADRAVL